MVGEFADARDAHPGKTARVVFVYQGRPEQGELFFGKLDANAVAIADPEAELYQAFGIERGGLREMFGLQAWKAGVRATLKGNMINRKIGDPWTMPTVFAVRDGYITGAFRGTHAGDHPDVPAMLRELTTEDAT
ncbi:MAG: AhpC/TSA family protein [Ilumatobacter sp.]